MIGDAQAGVAELRPDSRYNQDAVDISKKFALGVDILNVIVEAGPSACTTSYKAMETIDRFAWHMSNVPGVQDVITLPFIAKVATGASLTREEAAGAFDRDICRLKARALGDRVGGARARRRGTAAP